MCEHERYQTRSKTLARFSPRRQKYMYTYLNHYTYVRIVIAHTHTLPNRDVRVRTWPMVSGLSEDVSKILGSIGAAKADLKAIALAPHNSYGIVAIKSVHAPICRWSMVNFPLGAVLPGSPIIAGLVITTSINYGLIYLNICFSELCNYTPNSWPFELFQIIPKKSLYQNQNHVFNKLPWDHIMIYLW